MVVACSRCGFQNPPGARFCSSCGTPVGAPNLDHDHPTAVHDSLVSEGDTSPQTAVTDAVLSEGMVAMFVVLKGPKRGSRIHLDAERISIGRHPESDIFLDDVTVSRRHAELVRSGNSFVVSDAGSLNGTYVNKQPVDHQVLVDGDELRVGKFNLVYVDVMRGGGHQQ